MKEEEILAVLRLQSTKFVGDILAKKLINTVGSAAGIFLEKKNTLQKIDRIGSLITQHLFDPIYLKNAQKELQYINKNNIQYSYFLNEDYPEKLQNCVDAPIFFFKEGAMNFSNSRMISIVGTRKMTNYGRDFCEKLIEELSPYNPVIVSGFAYGVDICAHKSAIQNNLETIAVLAHGFEEIYPRVHKKYIHQVHQKGGFITEFFHNEKPLRENFLRRNRIVAGISDATIIIESGKKGGSLVTADIANSYNRDVFAVPGKVSDLMSKGCNDLIQQNKAHLLQSAEDLIKHLNWDVGVRQSKQKQKKLFVELNENEQLVYNYLLKSGQQLLDVISLETAIPIYQLTPILLQLELKNIVKPLPGKLFELS